MRKELLEEFIQEIRAYLPGYLVAFNGASFQVRNDYLGHIVVDKDIEEFGTLLRSKCGNNFRRVGGNEWLALFSSKSDINEVLENYYQEVPLNAGWKSLGELDGVTKEKSQTVAAKLIRTVRCISEFLTDSSRLKNTAIELVENNWALPPNKIYTLGTLNSEERKNWLCVSSLPDKLPCCPFCECEEFEWINGDTSIYGAYGICKKCRANVSITHAEYPA